MRIPFKAYHFSRPRPVSEEQFIALKLYPAEMRRARANATRGDWMLTLMRASGCIALFYLGSNWGSDASGILEVFVICLMFAGALSLFLTTGSYLVCSLDRAMWWHDVGALAKKHEDYDSFLKSGVRLELLSHPRIRGNEVRACTPGVSLPTAPLTQESARVVPDPHAGALRAHMRAYSVARLNAMAQDFSLSKDARQRAMEELRSRAT